MKDILKEISFWGIYVVIPMLASFIIMMIEGFMFFFIDKNEYINLKELDFYPNITIIIAVENCEKNLKRCLQSILEQNYPLNKIQVLLMDNNSTDGSKDIFYEMQIQYPKFRTWWIESGKGKVNAINKGIYISDGKYIINVDCNGRMGKNLLRNFVYRFENDHKVCALSSHVVTETEVIEKTSNSILKQLQKYELICLLRNSIIKENFIGRFDSMFMLYGECSAFRRDTLLKTQLYNSEIVNANIHMGYQIRKFLNGKIDMAEECFFYKKPLESIHDYYLEKQKAKKGRIEVFKLFKDKSRSNFNIFLNLSMIYNHTIMFMKIMFFFSTIYISLKKSNLFIMFEMWLFIYLLDLIISIICLIIIKRKIKREEDIYSYIIKNAGLIIVIPIYNFINDVFKIQGIVNSFESKEEIKEHNVINEIHTFIEKVKQRINIFRGEGTYEENL